MPSTQDFILLSRRKNLVVIDDNNLTRQIYNCKTPRHWKHYMIKNNKYKLMWFGNNFGYIRQMSFSPLKATPKNDIHFYERYRIEVPTLHLLNLL